VLNKYCDRSQRDWSGHTSNCRPNFPLNVSGDYIGLPLYIGWRRDLSMGPHKPLGKTDTRFTLVRQ